MSSPQQTKVPPPLLISPTKLPQCLQIKNFTASMLLLLCVEKIVTKATHINDYKNRKDFIVITMLILNSLTFLFRYYFKKSSIKIRNEENSMQHNNNYYLLIVYQHSSKK